MKDNKNRLLTTKDNPYNPWTQPEEWRTFDLTRGYYTDGLLARVAITSEDLSDELNSDAINQAVDQIAYLMSELYEIVYETTID